MTITRRRLLTTTGLSLAAAALPSRAEEAKAIADEKAVAPKPAAARTPAHTLVVIQLAGGNDGLNTVPPMADPLYKKLRPSLALASSEVLDLDGKLALHGAMSALHARLKAKNDVAILTGVHYPKSNRSTWNRPQSGRRRGCSRTSSRRGGSVAPSRFHTEGRRRSGRSG